MPKFPDPEKLKKFHFPNSLLNQISEASNGGYVLVYINHDGSPELVIKADNEMTKMGLIHFTSNFLTGVDEFNAAELRGEIIIGDNGEDGCGDEDCPDCNG